MKLTSLPQDWRTKLTNFSNDDFGRGSGRIWILAIALLLLPGAAFADDRAEFPGNLCPGSGCPGTAQLKQDECDPQPQCGGDEQGIEKCCTSESQQGPAGG